MKTKRNLIVSASRGRGGAGAALLSLLLFVPLMLSSKPASAVLADYIVVGLEEPAPAAMTTGVSNLRGWAVGKFGVERIELLIDSVYKFDIPYGGRRADVGSRYNYPNDDLSGFSMAYNYSNLAPGTHTITVRAWDIYDDFNEVTTTFDVVRFGDGGFIRGINGLDLSQASTAISGDNVTVYNAMVDSLPYQLTLRWHTQTQKPKLVGIRPFILSDLANAGGDWSVTMTTDASACGNVVAPFSGNIPLVSSGNTLDMNGLILTFTGVNPATLGTQYAGTQADVAGEIAWMAEVAGDVLTGTGTQTTQEGCVVLYDLAGTRIVP